MKFGAIQWLTAVLSLGVGFSCASNGPTSPSHAVVPDSAPSIHSGPNEPQAGGASAADTTSAPKPTRPKLRVGTSGDYAPFSIRDAAGTVRGFDADVAVALARDLGFELEWVGFRWPTL